MLSQGDLIFLFTDGIADQFGGPQGKRFKHRQLNDFLLQHKEASVPEIMQRLEQLFDGWRGELEQVDDVLFIGVKF